MASSEFLQVHYVEDSIVIWRAQTQAYGIDIPELLRLRVAVEIGTDRGENHAAYTKRLFSYIKRIKDVLGRFQEERQPGNDPGDDEDGSRGTDERSGLRSGGEVQPQLNWHETALTPRQTVPNYGGCSEQATEGGEGVPGQSTG